MGFEMPVDVDYFDHPKTLQLIALTGNKEADAFPLRLWRWCAKYAKNGVIEGGAPAIEAACRWRGAPGRLHAALVTAEFLNPDGVTIHDWMEGIGRAILIYDRKKQKQREKYDREKGILPEECRKSSGSIPPTLETLDEMRNSGGEGGQPPPPSSSASRETPEPTDDEIVAAVQRWSPTIPDHKIRSETTRAARLGVSKARLLNDVKTMGERLLIWTIVDLYQPQKNRNGNGNGSQRENATAYSKTEKSPVLDERREDVQKRQDEARTRCDELLEAMDPDEHDGWTRDAEAAADKAGANGGPARSMFVKSFLRTKVAKDNGIEGL